MSNNMGKELTELVAEIRAAGFAKEFGEFIRKVSGHANLGVFNAKPLFREDGKTKEEVYKEWTEKIKAKDWEWFRDQIPAGEAGPEGEDPAKEDPAKEDPAKEDPAKEDPAKEDPAKAKAPVKESRGKAPARKATAKEEPAKDSAPAAASKDTTGPSCEVELERILAVRLAPFLGATGGGVDEDRVRDIVRDEIRKAFAKFG